MKCEEARELITALIDQELLDPERPLLEMHLKECARCRFALEEERRLKTEIRAAADHLRAPAQLRDKILSDQRIVPKQAQSAKAWRDYIWPASLSLRSAVVASLLLIVALEICNLTHYTAQPVALAALESYDLFVSGDLSVIRASDAEEVREQL